jgi:invasion protein IalB
MHKLIYPVVMLIVLILSGLPSYAQNKSMWSTSCTEKNKANTCRMSQIHNASKTIKGKSTLIGRIMNIIVIYKNDAKTKKRTPHMTIQLPLGVDLRVGAIIQIDKNKEFGLPFLQCTNNGCDVSIKLNKKLLRSIQSGNKLKIGFRPWGGTGTTILTSSLSGFSKTFKSIK